MLLADVLFLAIVVYLGYRFVFNFLLPILRATHQVRQQFRNMRGSGNDSGAAGAGGPGFSGSSNSAFSGSGGSRAGTAAAGKGSGGPKGSYKPPAEDYIDFEEVK